MRLELEQLELRAGTFRLGPLNLAVGEGEYLILLGPTGAGKTLTLEATAGLRAPSAGTIRMNGKDVTRAVPEARRVGFLYQDSQLFPHLSVRGNILYGAHRLARPERQLTIARLARLLEVTDLMERMPRLLSGGERQRVALARALAAGPEMLLLDEPMAALDPNSRSALSRTLFDLHRELGTTTVHVTHSFSEARALGDRIAVLMGGKIVQVDSPAALFHTPGSEAVAEFLGARPRGETPTPRGPLYVLSVDPTKLAFRPCPEPNSQSLSPLVRAQACELSSETAVNPEEMFPASVVSAEPDGATFRLRLEGGIEFEACLPADPHKESAPAPGSTVWVRLTNHRH